MRCPLIVCNWKMAMTLEETRAFVTRFQALDEGRTSELDLVICPPATALATLAHEVEGLPIQVGAQDLSPYTEPAHTGQLSAELLADAGATWVLIGHFEVRRDRGDRGETMSVKVRRALEAGLRPILLLGEDEPDESVKEQLEERVRAVLGDCSAEEVQRMAFVYEPSWAIGKDEPASIEQIEQGAQALRDVLSTACGEEVGDEVPLIYGGSVTPENAERLLELQVLDGLGMGRKGRVPQAVAELVEMVLRQRKPDAVAEESAELWYWFLFESPLGTQRAKQLLARWHDEGWRVAEVLETLPDGAESAGLSLAEARKLQVPAELPPVEALPWSARSYPEGLHALPLRLRPALLFYRGSRPLLARPLLYLRPTSPSDEERELLRETAALLLGERVLPTALHASDQAAVLLEELAHTEGEVVLFVRSGLDEVTLSAREEALLEAGRLLLLSPLPPGTPHKPDLNPLLEQVEDAATPHSLLVSANPPSDLGDRTTEALWIAPPSTEKSDTMPGVQRLSDPAALLLWLAGLQTDTPAPASDPIVEELVSESPPSPEETLRILEQGGHVPEILRKRLQDES